jgi:chromate transporter
VEPSRPEALDVALYFARLGVTAFGGPAAHIALMRRDLVARRRWLSDADFIDLLGVTNLIPGPNSTEMTMHLGSIRAGRAGLWIAGAAFILPAVLITLACAWAYVEYGTTPTGEALLFGVQPVILAIIVQAIWGLRGAAVKGPATAIVLAIVVGLALANVNEIALLMGSGVALLLASLASGGHSGGGWPAAVRKTWGRVTAAFSRGRSLALVPLAALQAADGATTTTLFFVFLKIGAVLYGSGYVLVSFLEGEFVDSRGWLSQQELVDAVAVGQFTPGPVFSTATFVGYLLDGVPGAAAATAGIFLPSFVFVAVTHPLVPRLRRSPWASPFLDGVNAAAVALMAVVVVRLAVDALDSVFQLVALAAAAVVLLRFSPNSALLILGGAAAGVAWRLLT